jgi:hypothetical protein
MAPERARIDLQERLHDQEAVARVPPREAGPRSARSASSRILCAR